MGHFTSASDGEGYMRRYCDRCMHRDHSAGPGRDMTYCAVWTLHVSSLYAETPLTLNTLIPVDENGRNGQCNMFIHGDPPKDEPEAEQRDLFGGA